jgi:LemA protein
MADLRIPDDKASEVFELAARLYSESSNTYSEDELVQAGSEVQIPSEFIQEALRRIEVQEREAEIQRQQAQKRRKQLQIAAAAVGAIALGWAIWTYNSLTAARQSVDLAWGQVENQFQRRADLIPNLVNVTQAGAAQERELIELLNASRQNYLAAETQPEQVVAAQQINQALNQFQSYVAQNPQLQSSQLYIGLQDELAGTENRIAVERKRYNEQVAAYNRKVQSFPNTLVASLFGFQPQPLFQAENSAPPVIP